MSENTLETNVSSRFYEDIARVTTVCHFNGLLKAIRPVPLHDFQGHGESAAQSIAAGHKPIGRFRDITVPSTDTPYF